MEGSSSGLAMDEIIFETEDFFALTVLGEAPVPVPAPVGFDEVDFAGVLEVLVVLETKAALCFDFDIVSKIMVAV